jgi:hypothetical protein
MSIFEKKKKKKREKQKLKATQIESSRLGPEQPASGPPANGSALICEPPGQSLGTKGAGFLDFLQSSPTDPSLLASTCAFQRPSPASLL